MRHRIMDFSTPLVHLTLKSGNSKVGPIPVSTTESPSCAPSCVFKDSGCYAESGPLRIHWGKVDRGERGVGWEEFCSTISALPDNQGWRHNQAGDLPHIDGEIDRDKVFMLASANLGKRGFTYTHHDIALGRNLKTIWTLNELGFTVNLSANSPEHADDLTFTKLPVVCVLPIEQLENTKTPMGRTIVVCPAVVKEDVTCATCMLCQQRDRSTIVGFPAHGSGRKKVQQMLFETA
jgi:hypothetical protein